MRDGGVEPFPEPVHLKRTDCLFSRTKPGVHLSHEGSLLTKNVTLNHQHTTDSDKAGRFNALRGYHIRSHHIIEKRADGSCPGKKQKWGLEPGCVQTEILVALHCEPKTSYLLLEYFKV